MANITHAGRNGKMVPQTRPPEQARRGWRHRALGLRRLGDRTLLSALLLNKTMFEPNEAVIIAAGSVGSFQQATPTSGHTIDEITFSLQRPTIALTAPRGAKDEL